MSNGEFSVGMKIFTLRACVCVGECWVSGKWKIDEWVNVNESVCSMSVRVRVRVRRHNKA